MLIYVYVVLHICAQLLFFFPKHTISIGYNGFHESKITTNINRASHLLKDPEYPDFTYSPDTHNIYRNFWYPSGIFLHKPGEEGKDDYVGAYDSDDFNGTTHKNHNSDAIDKGDNIGVDDNAVNNKFKPNTDDIIDNKELSDVHTQTINPAKGITINNSIEGKRKYDDSFNDVKQAIYSLYGRAKDKGIEIDNIPELNTKEDIFKALDKLSMLLESYTYNLKSLDTGINQQFDNKSEYADSTLVDTSGQFLQLSRSQSPASKTISNQPPPHSIDKLRSFLDEFMETLNEVVSKNTGIVDLLGQTHKFPIGNTT